MTWDVVNELDAAHARDNSGVTPEAAVDLLLRNSAAAAAAIRALTDAELDRAATVSLNDARRSPASSCSRITPSATATTAWRGSGRR